MGDRTTHKWVPGTYSREDVFRILDAIPDPEIPVVSIKEMGMLRDVVINENGCEVILTPTYSGCPAMGIIEADIRANLNKRGISPVNVRLIYSPAWTTDWMTDEAKVKMRNYGIAPPLHSSCNNELIDLNETPCPACNSSDTVLVSRFGSTACKALYTCNNCKEPFEHFKCH